MKMKNQLTMIAAIATFIGLLLWDDQVFSNKAWFKVDNVYRDAFNTPTVSVSGVGVSFSCRIGADKYQKLLDLSGSKDTMFVEVEYKKGWLTSLIGIPFYYCESL